MVSWSAGYLVWFAIGHLNVDETVTKNVTIFGNNSTQWHTTEHNGIVGNYLKICKL